MYGRASITSFFFLKSVEESDSANYSGYHEEKVYAVPKPPIIVPYINVCLAMTRPRCSFTPYIDYQTTNQHEDSGNECGRILDGTVAIIYILSIRAFGSVKNHRAKGHESAKSSHYNPAKGLKMPKNSRSKRKDSKKQKDCAIQYILASCPQRNLLLGISSCRTFSPRNLLTIV